MHDLERRFGEPVGRREYEEFHASVDRQFTDVRDDIDDLRTRFDEDRKGRMDHWKQILYAGIVPFAVGILLMILTKGSSK